MLQFIDTVEQHGRQLRGIFLGEVPQDLKQILLAAGMQFDPGTQFRVIGYAFGGLFLQLDIHGQLTLVEAGDGFDLLKQILRPACQAQLLPRHPARHDISGNVRRREHRREINGRGAEAASGGQRPDRFALHVVGVEEADVPADGRIHAEEIEDAVLARRAPGHQRGPGRGGQRGYDGAQSGARAFREERL